MKKKSQKIKKFSWNEITKSLNRVLKKSPDVKIQYVPRDQGKIIHFYIESKTHYTKFEFQTKYLFDLDRDFTSMIAVFKNLLEQTPSPFLDKVPISVL